MFVTTNNRTSLVIGTRTSKLALWQAKWVQTRLQELVPNLSITLQRIKTSGDKISDVSLSKIGGKGLFVKEIEEALLRKEIDLAIHSLKDVPSELPEGLAILCVPERQDSRDAWLSREGLAITQLQAGAKVGTSSLRRQAQLLFYRSDLSINMLRGNLDTRVRKLQEGHFDAIVLAAAGLIRLGWENHVTEYLSSEVCLPAIGQGALGIEGRVDDIFVHQLLAPLNDPKTWLSVTAERSFLGRLEGGCQVPIAGHAVVKNDQLVFEGLVASIDGKKMIRDIVRGSVEDASELGVTLAERILEAGGREILNEIYGLA